MSDSAEKVKKIVVEHLGVEADKVTEEASFIDDLGADSLDIVELVMAFAEEFGVEIPDDAAEKITIVKDAITTIAETKGSSTPASRLIRPIDGSPPVSGAGGGFCLSMDSPPETTRGALQPNEHGTQP